MTIQTIYTPAKSRDAQARRWRGARRARAVSSTQASAKPRGPSDHLAVVSPTIEPLLTMPTSTWRDPEWVRLTRRRGNPRDRIRIHRDGHPRRHRCNSSGHFSLWRR